MDTRALGTRIATWLLVARQRYRQDGLAWLAWALARRAGAECAWIVLLPLAVLGHLTGWRRLLVFGEHIGHLAVEPDCLVKDVELGRLPRRRWFLLAPPDRVANAHLAMLWRARITVATHPLACAFLGLLARRGPMTHDVSRYVARYFGHQEVYRVNAEWGDRPPMLALPPSDDAWGRERLAALGLPPGAWFVAIHVREGGYLPRNEIIQSHRNASISNALLAMGAIVRRGGWCIRMGDASMTPLPALPGIIDYAHHPLKCARMDVFLCARARFFLGCTSGLAFLAGVFGVPVAHANMIPVETLGVRPGDLSIPMRVWSHERGRYLSYPELFGGPAGGYFFSQQYRDEGLEPRENDAEDILGLVREMLDRLDGVHRSTEEDEARQRRYLGLLEPRHYSWGAASRIAESFLARESDLL